MMKRVLIFAILTCAFPGRASAHYSRVNNCAGANNTSPSSCTITVQTNKLIIVSGWFYGSGGVSITDTLGILTSGNGTQLCQVYRAGLSNDYLSLNWGYSGATSGSDTITATAASGSADLSVQQYDTGLNSGAPDMAGPPWGGGCNPGLSTGAGTVSSNPITTSFSDDLIIGIGESYNGSAGISAGSGFTFAITPPNSIPGPPVLWLPIEDMLSSSPGSYASSIVQNSGGAWGMVVAAFPTFSGVISRHASFY